MSSLSFLMKFTYLEFNDFGRKLKANYSYLSSWVLACDSDRLGDGFFKLSNLEGDQGVCDWSGSQLPILIWPMQRKQAYHSGFHELFNLLLGFDTAVVFFVLLSFVVFLVFSDQWNFGSLYFTFILYKWIILFVKKIKKLMYCMSRLTWAHFYLKSELEMLFLEYKMSNVT